MNEKDKYWYYWLDESEPEESKPSPGPWFYDSCLDRAFGIIRDLGPKVAEENGVEIATEVIAEVCGASGGQDEADARLIAACPIMYDYIRRQAEKGDLEAAAIVERAEKGGKWSIKK
jgi:hypothetical protein